MKVSRAPRTKGGLTKSLVNVLNAEVVVDVEKVEPNRGRMAISLPALAARVKKMIEVVISILKTSGCQVRAARQGKGEINRRVRARQNKTHKA